jgi:hypothetical protein
MYCFILFSVRFSCLGVTNADEHLHNMVLQYATMFDEIEVEQIEEEEATTKSTTTKSADASQSTSPSLFSSSDVLYVLFEMSFMCCLLLAPYILLYLIHTCFSRFANFHVFHEFG